MAKHKISKEIKKRHVFSIVYKIIFLCLEFIFIGSSIYNFTIDISLAIVLLLVGILIILLDTTCFSFVTFDKDNIRIFNKFKITYIPYNEIKRIEIIESIKSAFLFGSIIEIKLIFKNDKHKKILIGQIIRYHNLINYIKDIARYRCIKIIIRSN